MCFPEVGVPQDCRLLGLFFNVVLNSLLLMLRSLRRDMSFYPTYTCHTQAWPTAEDNKEPLDDFYATKLAELGFPGMCGGSADLSSREFNLLCTSNYHYSSYGSVVFMACGLTMESHGK